MTFETKLKEWQEYRAAERARLEAQLVGLREQWTAVEKQINKLDNNILNYVFSTVKEAVVELEDELYERAADETGDGYHGSDEYTQEFIVDGILYEFKMQFEYNRHDKRFYYIDHRSFDYSEIGPYTGESSDQNQN